MEQCLNPMDLPFFSTTCNIFSAYHLEARTVTLTCFSDGTGTVWFKVVGLCIVVLTFPCEFMGVFVCFRADVIQ